MGRLVVLGWSRLRALRTPHLLAYSSRYGSAFSHRVVSSTVLGIDLRHRGDIKTLKRRFRIGNQVAVATRHDRLREAGTPDMRSEYPTACKIRKHALEVREGILKHFRVADRI